jgi:Kelch motif protein
LEASLPAPRQEVASATAGSALYVIGGFDSGRRDTNSVFVYTGGRWSSGHDFPIAVDHASAATLEEKLYVAGGNSGGVAEASLFRFDGSGWTQLRAMRHPRGALALVAAGGRLFALGGIAAGVEVAAVESYDPAADSWSDVTSLFLPRDHGAGFAVPGRVCLAGGRSPNTARVDCYEPATAGWTALPDLSVPTSGAGAALVNGTIIVAGGEDAGEGRLVNHIFRTSGPGWSDQPMLVPRHGFQLAEFGGRAWACGGATAPGYAASAVCTSIA